MLLHCEQIILSWGLATGNDRCPEDQSLGKRVGHGALDRTNRYGFDRALSDEFTTNVFHLNRVITRFHSSDVIVTHLKHFWAHFGAQAASDACLTFNGSSHYYLPLEIFHLRGTAPRLTTRVLKRPQPSIELCWAKGNCPLVVGCKCLDFPRDHAVGNHTALDCRVAEVLQFGTEVINGMHGEGSVSFGGGTPKTSSSASSRTVYLGVSRPPILPNLDGLWRLLGLGITLAKGARGMNSHTKEIGYLEVAICDIK